MIYTTSQQKWWCSYTQWGISWRKCRVSGSSTGHLSCTMFMICPKIAHCAKSSRTVYILGLVHRQFLSNVNWGDVLSEKLVNAPIETRGRPGDPFWWICGQSWVPKIWFSRETQQWNILSADKNTMKSSIFWWILQGAMARSARRARKQWRLMDDFGQVLVTLSWIWITVDWLDHENIFKPS